MPLVRQVRGHVPTLVGRETIPNQDGAVTEKVAVEILQETDEVGAVVTPRPRLEEQPAAPAIPPEGQGQGDGQLRPAEGMDQDRRFAPRGPRAADRWALRDPALVLEDEPGPLAPSVFFTAGQRGVTQCRIAGSFRSVARFAGRWSVQSSAPRAPRRRRVRFLIRGVGGSIPPRLTNVARRTTDGAKMGRQDCSPRT